MGGEEAKAMASVLIEDSGEGEEGAPQALDVRVSETT